MYTRIIEEGVEIDDARYFDLPVKVVIKEEVIPNRLELTDKTEKSRFSPSEEKNLEYRISNQNNIPLDVVIRLDQPDGWEGAIRATSSQLGSDFLIINLPAYSSKDFSVTMIAPEDLKDSEEVSFEFRVTPMNNETPFEDEYVQRFTFSYMTECTGAACLLQELVNPEPQTMVFYALILGLLFYARGRSGRGEKEGYEFVEYDVEDDEEKMLKEDDDLPPPVVAQEDLDDDLELLEELDDL